MSRSLQIFIISLALTVSLCVNAKSAEFYLLGLKQPELPGQNDKGSTIDSIEIDNRQIYDTDKQEYNKFAFRTANRLHSKTREHVVRRELLFRVGEAYDPEVAEETARNLRKRYSLNDAWIETIRLPGNRLLVRVVTIDQWSLLGGAKIRRDGNRTDYQFGVEERNFLGYNQSMTFDYFIKGRQENFIATSFRDGRIAGKPLSVEFNYKSDPMSLVRGVTISRPYYNLSQNYSFSTSVARLGGRRDYYNEGIRNAESVNRIELASANGEYRWGTYNRKIAIGLAYQYNRQVVLSRNTLPGDTSGVPNPFNAGNFTQDSLYHLVVCEIKYQHLQFVALKRINGYNYLEDFELGFELSGAYGGALNPDFNSSQYDVILARGFYGQHFGANVIQASYTRSIYFHGGDELRRTSNLGLLYYSSISHFFTLACRGSYTSNTSAGSDNTLNLGGKNGLRGYNQFFRSGDKINVYNIEARFWPGTEIASVIIGGVIFADVGAIWTKDAPIRLARYNKSLGVGLRLSLEKFAKSESLRIDLSHDDDDNWQLTFGTGQYFRHSAF
ncbi:MAG: hypothetical protein SGI97_00475 [candidate division Zixibacteria bacterium]|nr:hypothetical protein [candidate division Zixibacteria bacterium]